MRRKLLEKQEKQKKNKAETSEELDQLQSWHKELSAAGLSCEILIPTSKHCHGLLLVCNISSATCNAILSEWANQSSSFARCRRLSASAILFVIVRVASCEKSCKRVTPLLQLERFFIRHRCNASCKKNCLV